MPTIYQRSNVDELPKRIFKTLNEIGKDYSFKYNIDGCVDVRVGVQIYAACITDKTIDNIDPVWLQIFTKEI